MVKFNLNKEFLIIVKKIVIAFKNLNYDSDEVYENDRYVDDPSPYGLQQIFL